MLIAYDLEMLWHDGRSLDRSTGTTHNDAAMESYLEPVRLTLIVHLLIAFVIAVRVIMSRPGPGVGLAWILLVESLPFFGAGVYLLIGERRIGLRRARRLAALRVDFAEISQVAMGEHSTNVDWSRHPPAARAMDTLGRKTTGSPTVHGSRFQLMAETPEILRTIAEDIDRARFSVLMEFYIWHKGGLADDVVDALVRAAERGVFCLVLVDAIGSGPWWRSRQPRRLRKAGVNVRRALSTGLFRTIVGRTDLRLHRKVIVVDGEAAWTGSMNLVDPRFFKQSGGYGQWVDAMVRLEGAAVATLAATVIWDWALETGESFRDLIAATHLERMRPIGTADIQVIPSGPVETQDSLLQMLLALINAAGDELVMTTPYLVPDDAMTRAIRGAAGRGVRVTLIVPEHVDSFLTRHASRSYYRDLLDMGVRIRLYHGGLLHTKSISVDGALSMFGTVNLDHRSLWLNYEVALFVYDEDFTKQLRALQQSYMDDSDVLDDAAWSARPFRRRLLENTLRLASPLL